MNNKLELLALAKDFDVTKKSENIYEIEHINSDLGAVIGNNEITYYLTGCYDSGSDWLGIDIKNLNKLQKFCELMVEVEQ